MNINNQSEHNIGLIKCHISSLLLSLTAIFAKTISLPMEVVTSFRALFASLVLVIFCFLFKRKYQIKSKSDFFLILFTGFLMGVHWYFYFCSIYVSTVAIGIITLFTYPIISSIIEHFFTQDETKRYEIISAIILLFGIILIIPVWDFSNNIFQGVLLGLISSTSLSIRNVLTRRFLANYSSIMIMSLQNILVLLLFLPSIFILEDLNFSKENIISLIILGAFVTAIGHTLLVSSLKHLKASLTGIIASTQTIYAILLGFFILNEIPSIRTLLGGAIIISIILYNSKKSSKLSKTHAARDPEKSSG